MDSKTSVASNEGQPKPQRPQRTLTIHQLSAKGLGEGVTDTGGKLTVAHTIPGEVVRAEKLRRQQGKLLEIQQVSPQRVAPTCSHVGTCGGCLWQHISYNHQLELKRGFVQRLFEMNGLAERVDDWPVHPSSPLQYRNRMDFVWWFDGRFGLRQQGKWRSIVPLTECHLIHPDGMEIAFEVNRRVQAAGLPFRDSIRHTAGMRYLILRHGVFTGEWMLALVSDEMELSSALWEDIPNLTSVYQLINRDTHNDVSDGEPVLMQGAESYRERIAGHEFHIGPRSFFQPNPAVAEAMVYKLQEWLPDSGERLLDLYCGIGLFSETLASRFAHVDGVEVVDEAIARAKAHSVHEHVQYHSSDALEWVRANPASYDALVIDPPRSGIHPDVLKAIRESGIPQIAYVSCNPKVGVKDLAKLAESYEIRSIELFDQFPQTPHVELLVDLHLRTD